MLLRPISMHAEAFSHSFNETASMTKKLTTIALFTALSVILQSAGGFIPVAGLFISPFATAPIMISSTLSKKYGILGYLLTIFLLILIQPSEVLIFTFTTGLLGMGIGLAYHVWKRRLSLIISGTIALLSGILIVLLVFQFPLLGPSIQPAITLPLFLSLACFSFFYSWIWIELSVFLFKRLKR